MLSIAFLKPIILQMWQCKTRNLLAILGVMWGSLAVLLLLALGSGFMHASKKNLLSQTSGLLIAHAGFASIPYEGLPQGRRIHITAKEVMDFAATQKNASISPLLGDGPPPKRYLLLHDKQHATDIPVVGVNSNFANITHMLLTAGSHFISQINIQQQNFVTVIGASTKTSLFGHKKAIGQLISISGIPFRVIGVVSDKPQQYYEGAFLIKNRCYIPYTTMVQVWGDMPISQIFMLPKNPAVAANLAHLMRNYFALEKHFSVNDKPAFDIPDTLQQLRSISWFLTAIKLFLGLCGLMTLAVSAIGVANMMFLTVSERTSEIGLRMALGAKDYMIKRQIMCEAMIIVGIGGSLGFLICTLILNIIHLLTLPDWLGQPQLNSDSAASCFIILLLTSLLAGYFPAKRAAKMHPVDALSC